MTQNEIFILIKSEPTKEFWTAKEIAMKLGITKNAVLTKTKGMVNTDILDSMTMSLWNGWRFQPQYVYWIPKKTEIKNGNKSNKA